MKRKVEFMLDDSFEVTGEWWLPENQAEKRSGTLRYSPTDIQLELNDSFDEVSNADVFAGSPKFENHPCIHGRTNDLQRITLLGAYATSRGAATIYKPAHILARQHVPALPELKLRKVSFYCHHLDRFILRDLFTMENDGEKENFKSCTVKYHQPKTLSWRLKSGATIDFQTSMNWSSNQNEQWQKLHAQSFVTITPDSEKDLDWYIRQIWRFCYLLSLVTDEVISPTGVKVFRDDDSPVWYLYKSGKKREANERSSPVFLFHLGHLIHNFEDLLNKWFSVSETLLDSIHLMMDAQRNQEHNIHGRFLLLAHAVEVVSRATTSSEYMAKADYDKVIDVINRAIPKTVNSDHRMSLKSRIKYGNEFAFHKRIRVLLDSLSDEGRKIVCKDAGRFSRGIADTRNYYTHFTDELRTKALPPVPMFWASEKLSFLMRIVLLRHLGIEEKVILERMLSHFRLSQRINLANEHPEVMTDA